MYVLTLTYTAPLSEIDARLDEHNAWLDEHYASGLFLGSGRRVPRVGGVIITRDADRADLDEILAAEPFLRDEVAIVEVTEFVPSKGALATLGEQA